MRVPAVGVVAVWAALACACRSAGGAPEDSAAQLRALEGEECRALTVYPRRGNPRDRTLPLEGPGSLVLSGGRDEVPDAYRWAHRQLTGDPRARGGDLILLRATHGDSAQELLDAAPFNSAQTLCVPADATAEELSEAARRVARANAVFFAGGQQARYVRWKGSPLAWEVQRIYERGGVVGGISAGTAILGQHVFDGERASSEEVTTPALVKGPDNPNVTWTRELFDFPPLRGAITDTHFRERDRFGRLTAFLAMQPDEDQFLGIGVDSGSALCIDRRGMAHLERNGSGEGGAWFLRGRGDQVRPGEPLGPVSVQVSRLDAGDEWLSLFDLRSWEGMGCAEYDVTVDGSARNPYSVNPYTGS